MAEVVSLPVMVKAGGSRFRSDLHAADRVLHGGLRRLARPSCRRRVCLFRASLDAPALNLLVPRFGVRRLAAAFPHAARRFNQSGSSSRTPNGTALGIARQEVQ